MEHKNLPHDHGYHNEEEIMKNMPGEDEIAGVSEAMKQLGDPSRLRIFWLLCHCEECVLNIAAIVNMTSPAVSHHLRLLKGSGLIVSRGEGHIPLRKCVRSAGWREGRRFLSHRRMTGTDRRRLIPHLSAVQAACF